MTEEKRPTIKSRIPFMVGTEVEALRKAMKGLGTDEQAIIKVLTSCSSNQRQSIAQEYKKVYDRDLIEDLKKELSGEFENTVLALMTRSIDFLARELEHALEHKKGEAVVEILFTHEQTEINAIKKSFRQQDDDTLAEEVKEELTGVFGEVVLATVEGKRTEEYQLGLPNEIAKAIHNDEHGVNKAELVRAFSGLSYKELKEMLIEYYKLAGRTLGEAFQLVFKGEERTNMLALFQCIDHRSGFFASSFRKAMAGPGTKDRDLIRLVVSRSEVDLINIKEEFFKMFDRTLEDEIKGDTSGDYKKILLALLQPNY